MNENNNASLTYKLEEEQLPFSPIKWTQLEKVAYNLKFRLYQMKQDEEVSEDFIKGFELAAGYVEYKANNQRAHIDKMKAENDE